MHLSYDQRLAHVNLDSQEKRSHIADLTEYFKIINNISISHHSILFPLQIILILVVVTINFTKHINI